MSLGHFDGFLGQLEIKHNFSLIKKWSSKLAAFPLTGQVRLKSNVCFGLKADIASHPKHPDRSQAGLCFVFDFGSVH